MHWLSFGFRTFGNAWAFAAGLLMQGTHIALNASGVCSLFRSGGYAAYTPQATQPTCISAFSLCGI